MFLKDSICNHRRVYKYKVEIILRFKMVKLCTCASQEAESNRQCRRLQLKDMIPVEMQRLTKYPLLLENIAKYTGIKPFSFFSPPPLSLTFNPSPHTLNNICVRFLSDDTEEKSKVKRACECCRQILNHVNQEVKEAENKQVSRSRHF